MNKDFEEEFPSSLDYYEECEIATFPDGTIVADGLVDINDIRKYCLDKARVKEAIIELCFHSKEKIYRDALLKKLGLGDIKWLKNYIF